MIRNLLLVDRGSDRTVQTQDETLLSTPILDPRKRETAMLSLAVTFLIIALIAGLFGFGLVGGMAYGAAKICFFIFLVLAILSLLSRNRISV